MRRHTLPLAGALLLATISAQAGTDQDGVTLINQATVMAAGGFPFQIAHSGSYKLSSDLVLPGGSYEDGIEISSGDVTLDLNGFALISPVCSINSQSACGGSAVGGASVGHTAIVIRNGSIQGWTFGVNLPQCTGCSVEQVSIRNAQDAIVLGDEARIIGNVLTSTVDRNGVVAIQPGQQAFIQGNTITGFGLGIRSQGNDNIASNLVSRNGTGIQVTCPSLLVGNFAAGNGTDLTVYSGSGCAGFTNNPAL
jgi:hypothetical protein